MAADAIGRAASFVRGEARKKPGTVPPQAVRLAKAHVELQAMRHNWGELRDRVRRARRRSESPLDQMTWALRLNQLKIAASEMAPKLVHEALQIVGIMAYKNDSKYSVGRQYRDHAVGGADGLERTYRREERVDASGAQGRVRCQLPISTL